MNQVSFKVGNKEYKTFDDFGVLLAHIDFGFPAVKSTYVAIEGRDGDLDMTESLNGMPHYENRTITMDFKIIHVPYNGYLGTITEIATAVHGKKCEIVFDADKGYKFIGRCSVESYDREIDVGTFTISAECEPYKIPLYNTSSNWIWDEFDFENGILYQADSTVLDFENMSVSYEYTIIGKPVIPQIDAVADTQLADGTPVTLTIEGDGFTLTDDFDVFKDGGIVLDEDWLVSGDITLTLTRATSGPDVDVTVVINQGGVI